MHDNNVLFDMANNKIRKYIIIGPTAYTRFARDRSNSISSAYVSTTLTQEQAKMQWILSDTDKIIKFKQS